MTDYGNTEHIPWHLFDQTSVLSVFILIAIIYAMTRKRPTGIPPGPTTWIPCVGNMTEFSSSDIRTSLRRLRRQYGPVYSVYFGNRLTVIISGYTAIKEAFGKGDMFSYRPKMFLTEMVGEGYGLSTTNGEVNQIHRKFTLGTFRNIGLGSSNFQQKIRDEIRSNLRLIHETNGEPFDLRQKLTVHVANVICSAMFGGHYSHTDKDFEQLLDNLIESFQLGSASAAVNFFPFLRFIPGDPIKGQRVLTVTNNIKNFILKIIQERMASNDTRNVEDYTSAFFRQMMSPGHPSFTERQLVLSIADLFGGGTESIATTIQWSLLYMINFPEVQEKMFTEITEHVGKDRIPSVSDRRNLKYTEAFIMEVQRICDVVILCPPHTVTMDTVFMGYKIPKETIVLPDMPSVHSDQELWGDPENFRPERFIDEDGNVFKPEFFIPFFLGKRQCIGEALAKTELFLFVSSIVQSFQFLPPDGVDVSIQTLDGVFGISHQPKSFNVIAVPRQGVNVL